MIVEVLGQRYYVVKFNSGGTRKVHMNQLYKPDPKTTVGRMILLIKIQDKHRFHQSQDNMTVRNCLTGVDLCCCLE